MRPCRGQDRGYVVTRQYRAIVHAHAGEGPAPARHKLGRRHGHRGAVHTHRDLGAGPLRGCQLHDVCQIADEVLDTVPPQLEEAPAYDPVRRDRDVRREVAARRQLHDARRGLGSCVDCEHVGAGNILRHVQGSRRAERQPRCWRRAVPHDLAERVDLKGPVRAGRHHRRKPDDRVARPACDGYPGAGLHRHDPATRWVDSAHVPLKLQQRLLHGPARKQAPATARKGDVIRRRGGARAVGTTARARVKDRQARLREVR